MVLGVILFGMRRGPKRPNFKFKNTEGVQYEVLFYKPHEKHFDGAMGICQDPEDEHPKIYISPYLTDQSELTLLYMSLLMPSFG